MSVGARAENTELQGGRIDYTRSAADIRIWRKSRSHLGRTAWSTYVTSSSLGLSSRYSLSVLNLRPLASGDRNDFFMMSVCCTYVPGERRKKVFLYDDRLAVEQRATVRASVAAERGGLACQGSRSDSAYSPFVPVSSKLQSLPHLCVGLSVCRGPSEPRVLPNVDGHAIVMVAVGRTSIFAAQHSFVKAV